MPLFNSDYIIYRGICGMATVKKSNKKKIIAAISIVLVIAIIGTVIGVSAKSKKERNRFSHNYRHRRNQRICQCNGQGFGRHNQRI